MTFDQTRLDHLPNKCGIYLMKNSLGKIIYVGKAKILKARVKQYFIPGQDQRAMIPYLISQVEEIETIVTFNEKEALLLENTLIKKHKPKYNVLLKDDKTHLSILINQQHAWPRAQLIRTKEVHEKKGEIFGPYTSALAARKTFDILNKVFPLRECSDRELSSRKRPCILHSMGRCLAPCVNKCTKKEYDEIVSMAISFLKGKSNSILAKLKEELKQASDNLQFEKAHILHKTITQIEETIHQKSNVVQFHAKDCDVFNFIKKDAYILIVKLLFREGRLVSSEHFDFNQLLSTDAETLTTFLLMHYQEKAPAKEILLPIEIEDQSILEELLDRKILVPKIGEKRQLTDLALENAKALFEQEQSSTSSNEEILLSLKEKLQLTQLPMRIECFDTSCSSQKEFVASLVVYINGVKSPKHYRLYKIRSSEVKDDTAAMHEVLYRRLSKVKSDEEYPNLILVDGGKGQLTQLVNVLKMLNIASIDAAALAKEQSRHDRGLTKERVFRPHQQDPIEFSRHSSILFFLQQIRDEAHRRAITFHRQKRAEKSVQSLLDAAPGIGKVKKQRLLKHFGSVKNIADASVDEIAAVEGISMKDATALKKFLSNP